MNEDGTFSSRGSSEAAPNADENAFSWPALSESAPDADDATADKLSNMGYPLVSSVNFRMSPKTTSPKIRIIKKYALLHILNLVGDEDDQWYYVDFNGQEGFIKANYVKHMTIGEARAFLSSSEYQEGKKNNMDDNLTKPVVAEFVPSSAQELKEISDGYFSPVPTSELIHEPISRLTPEPVPEPTLEPEPEPFVFRSFQWGTGKETVLQSGGSPVASWDVPETADGTYIRYVTSAVGLDMLLDYYFSSKGLYMIRYTCTEELIDQEELIEVLAKLSNAYEKKYGNSSDYRENWVSQQYKSDYQDKEFEAITNGYVTYSVFWYLDNSTAIEMLINRDKAQETPVITITYLNVEYGPEAVDYSNEI